MLLLLLRPRLGGINLRDLGGFTLNVIAASVVAALAALLRLPRGAPRAAEVGDVADGDAAGVGARPYLGVVVGLGFYLGFSRFLGTDDVISLGSIARRVFKR